MPDILKIVLLAIVQGVTEFLPVSSSGHLGLATHLLGLDTPNVLLEVTVHVGTLLSVIFYYRKTIVGLGDGLFARDAQARRMLAMLVVSVLPIAVVGVAGRAAVERLFDRPVFIAAMLLVTGVILLSLLLARRTGNALRMRHAVLMGFAQALAILPGISRSGATIVAARHCGIAPARAAEFSLLMMIPAIGGALVMSVGEVMRSGMGSLTVPHLLIACAVAAAVGYGAIAILIRMLNAGRFPLFGLYCLALGSLALALL